MTKKIRKISLVLISILLSFSLFVAMGCDNKNGGETVQSITFEKTNITVEVDTDVTLKVVSVGIEQKNIVWESSDITIASVEDGCVVGVKPGTVEITAKCGDVSAKCTVVVVPSSNYPTLTINKTSLNLFKNSEFKLNSYVHYNGELVESLINFESSNPTVCTVDSVGKLVAVSYGKAEIKVNTTYNSIELEEVVTVTVIPDLRISIFEDGNEKLLNDFNFDYGEEVDFTLKVYLEGQEISNPEFVVEYDEEYLNVEKTSDVYSVSSIKAGATQIKINSTYDGYEFDSYINISVNKMTKQMSDSYIINKDSESQEIVLPSEIKLSNDLTIYFDKESNGRLSVSSFDDSTKTINLDLSDISIMNDGLNTICVDDGISTIYKFENCVFPTKIFTQEDAGTFTTTIDQKLNGYYVLGSDIDFGGKEIGRIGLYASYAFSGTFDGQGYTLKNFVTSKASSGVDDIKWANNALFAYVVNGTIKNTYFEFKTAKTFMQNQSTIGLVGAVWKGSLTMENVAIKMTLKGAPADTVGSRNFGKVVSPFVTMFEDATLTLTNVVGIIDVAEGVEVAASDLVKDGYCGVTFSPATLNDTNVLYANSVSDNYLTELEGFTASGSFTKEGNTLKFGDEVVYTK